MWLGFSPWAATLKRWRSESGIADYIDEYVVKPGNHMAYLEKVGGLATLSALKADPILGY